PFTARSAPGSARRSATRTTRATFSGSTVKSNQIQAVKGGNFFPCLFRRVSDIVIRVTDSVESVREIYSPASALVVVPPTEPVYKPSDLLGHIRNGFGKPRERRKNRIPNWQERL